jgi:hypothetical protein
MRFIPAHEAPHTMNRLRGVRPKPCRFCLCLLPLVLAAACKGRNTDPTGAPDPRALAAIPQHANALAPSPSAGAAPGGAAARERPTIVFSERHGGVAHVVGEGGAFRVVHNGRAGRRYAAIGEVVLSPDGRRCAHGAVVDGRWRMVVDGEEGEPFDAVEAPLFGPDGAHVAYQARNGERWHLVVDSTVNGGTRGGYLTHELGSSRIAYVDEPDDQGRGRLVVSDLAFRKETVVVSRVSALIRNAGRSRLAAVATADGKQRVVSLHLDAPDRARTGAAYDAVSGVVFSEDGASLAYLAERSGARLLVRDDEEASVGSGHVIAAPVIAPGRKAVGALVASLSGSVLFREFFVDDGPQEPPYEEAEALAYDPQGPTHAYAARRGASWFIVLNGKEGPPFDRVVSPVFSRDGRYLAYRARQDGKRFVVVVDTAGGGMSLHAAHEQVFPVLFTADGKSIAYGVKDGERIAWSVEAP